MLSNAERQLAHPKSSTNSSWFSSADSQRLRKFKNTAMRRPLKGLGPADPNFSKRARLAGQIVRCLNRNRVLSKATLAALVEIDSPN
jgi:hypothetical protein